MCVGRGLFDEDTNGIFMLFVIPIGFLADVQKTHQQMNKQTNKTQIKLQATWHWYKGYLNTDFDFSK